MRGRAPHGARGLKSDDLFIPDGGFSPTKEEVDNMNRAKETADKAAKVLDTLFGGLADLLKTI